MNRGVSVVVRTMGRPCLAAALDSVRRQSWRPLELVLVNASGTGQPEAERLLRELPAGIDARYVDPGSALPRPRAANAGLDHANGEWIAFLDEDDEWLPGHLVGLMHAALALDEPGVVYGDARLVDAGGNEIGIVGGPLDELRMHASSPCAIHGALIPRALLARGCRFDERLTHREDQDFWLQARQVMDFTRVEQALAIYRVDAGASGTNAGMRGNREQLSDSERLLAEKWRAQREHLAGQMGEWMRRAQAALSARDYAGAEQILMQAFARFPKDVNLYNLLGMVHLATGRVESAVPLLRQAVALAPGHFGIVFNLGLALERSGDAAGAAACFRRATELNPEFDPARRRRAT